MTAQAEPDLTNGHDDRTPVDHIGVLAKYVRRAEDAAVMAQRAAQEAEQQARAAHIAARATYDKQLELHETMNATLREMKRRPYLTRDEVKGLLVAAGVFAASAFIGTGALLWLAAVLG